MREKPANFRRRKYVTEARLASPGSTDHSVDLQCFRKSKARQQITIHIYGRAFSGQMNTTEKGQYQRCLPLGLGGGNEERPCQHRSGDRLDANSVGEGKDGSWPELNR